LGILGGYTWSASVDPENQIVSVAVYLFVSATRRIALPGGREATVTMDTDMPWKGRTTWSVNAPEGWKVRLLLPRPAYAEDYKVRSLRVETGYRGSMQT
jgi:hypothetical protein